MFDLVLAYGEFIICHISMSEIKFRSFQEQMQIIDSLQIPTDTQDADAQSLLQFCEQIKNFQNELQNLQVCPTKEETKVEESTDTTQVHIELLTEQKNELLAEIEAANERKEQLKKQLMLHELKLIKTLRKIKLQYQSRT